MLLEDSCLTPVFGVVTAQGARSLVLVCQPGRAQHIPSPGTSVRQRIPRSQTFGQLGKGFSSKNRMRLIVHLFAHAREGAALHPSVDPAAEVSNVAVLEKLSATMCPGRLP